MRIVLDVSAVVPVILGNDKVTHNILRQCDIILAPALYQSELGNTLLQYLKHDVISADEAIAYFEQGVNLISKFVDMHITFTDIMLTALKLSISYYDAEYLHLARSSGCKLLTGDKKLQIAAISESLNLEI